LLEEGLLAGESVGELGRLAVDGERVPWFGEGEGDGAEDLDRIDVLHGSRQANLVPVISRIRSALESELRPQ
jgi:hypothetical protein